MAESPIFRALRTARELREALDCIVDDFRLAKEYVNSVLE